MGELPVHPYTWNLIYHNNNHITYCTVQQEIIQCMANRYQLGLKGTVRNPMVDPPMDLHQLT
jgi:hypothetical protein